MEVGEICCDNLTSSQAASGFMESRRRYADRLKRFIDSSRWEVSRAGDHHIRQKKLHLEVVPKNGSYALRVEGKNGKLLFPTINEAKAKAFEVIESGKAGEYIAKITARRWGRRI